MKQEINIYIMIAVIAVVTCLLIILYRCSHNSIDGFDDRISILSSSIERFQSTRNVWVYWTGPQPKLITILFDIMKLHSKNGINYTLNILNDDNITTYVNLPPFFNHMIPAHKADYIRVKIILSKGGIWLDADTLVMGNLNTLFTYTERKDGFFIKENNKILCNGVFGSKPQTKLMKEWDLQMETVLSKKSHNIEWTEIGSSILDKLYKRQHLLFKDCVIINGLENLYRVNWNQPHIFFKKDNARYERMKDDELVVLVGEVYRMWEKSNNENSLLKSLIDKSYKNNT